MLQTPISFNSKVFAGKWSNVFTSMRYFSLPNVSDADCVLDLRIYCLPGIIASSLIHKIRDWNWSASPHGSFDAAIISPLETSISSFNVIVTDWPADAFGNSPSQVIMLSIVDSLPPGCNLILSPTLVSPLAISPVNPLKLEFGRFTHWTGILKGACFLWFRTSIFSRYCMIVSPLYHGVFSLCSTTLSPNNAEIGTAVIDSISSASSANFE